MKNTVCLVLLLAFALPATAGEKPYTSAKLGFVATFPYPAQEKDDPDGGGTVAAVDPSGIMYMVGVTASHPEVASAKDLKQQLDDGLASTLAKVHGTAESQKDVKLGKYPGREVKIALQGGHATFRFFVVKTRSLMIGVVHKDGATLPVAPADFFKTLQLK